MTTVTLEHHLAVVAELQEQLAESHSLRVAMAILLVKAAGGKIVVTELMALNMSNTSYIQEYHDHATGERVFETFEEPTEGKIH
jgi:hypothetical protein